MATYSGNEGAVHLALNGFTVTFAERASNNVIITTSSAHGFSNGDSITIVGIQGLDGGTDTNPNGTFTLSAVTTSTMTFAQTGSDVGPVAQTASMAYAAEAGTMAEIMSFTIDQQMETIDTTVMKSAWRTHKVGLKTWTATIECRWDDTDAEQEIAVGTQVFAVFVPVDQSGQDNASLVGFGKITTVSQTQTFDNSTINRTITITGNGPQSLTYA
jgi:hypothetical protein